MVSRWCLALLRTILHKFALFQWYALFLVVFSISHCFVMFRIISLCLTISHTHYFVFFKYFALFRNIPYHFIVSNYFALLRTVWFCFHTLRNILLLSNHYLTVIRSASRYYFALFCSICSIPNHFA